MCATSRHWEPVQHECRQRGSKDALGHTPNTSDIHTTEIRDLGRANNVRSINLSSPQVCAAYKVRERRDRASAALRQSRVSGLSTLRFGNESRKGTHPGKLVSAKSTPSKVRTRFAVANSARILDLESKNADGG